MGRGRPAGRRISLPVAGLPPQVRRAGAGISQDAVNWICVPPEATDLWTPSYGEMQALVQEGQALAHQVSQVGMPPRQATMRMLPPQMAPVAAAWGAAGPVGVSRPAGGVGPAGQVLLPLAGGGPPGLSAAVAAPAGPGGLLGLAPPASGSSGDVGISLKSLASAVEELRRLAHEGKPGHKKSRGERDRERAKKKKDRDRSDRGRRRKDSRSCRKGRRGSSSSSRSSDRSSSSSSGSSRLGEDAPICWEPRMKRKKITVGQVRSVDAAKFKRKSELLSYASKNPGALTAYFLVAVFMRISKGMPTKTGDL